MMAYFSLIAEDSYYPAHPCKARTLLRINFTRVYEIQGPKLYSSYYYVQDPRLFNNVQMSSKSTCLGDS